MENLPDNGNARAGTTGGLLLVLLLQIGGGELLKTIVLAGVGAAVSFSVSMGMKWLVRKFRQK
jgi:hypothetical protein